MSIYGTIYKSTSGLLTYSKGLDVVSNNVANLNTPGFKRSDLVFKDLFYEYKDKSSNYNSGASGNGVSDNGTITSFAQGDLQQTDNDTDVAIDGNGFFVLRDGDSTFYSRVGQFQIDDNDYLVSSTNGANVVAINSSGDLIDINLDKFRVNPPKSTSRVSFNDNLSTGSTEHTVADINIFDSLGEQHALELTLTNNSSVLAGSWLATVKDENNVDLAVDQEIRFNTNGTPTSGFNSFEFSIDFDSAETSNIVFDFGEADSFSGATSFSSGSTSELKFDAQNGFGVGSQTNLAFDSDGFLNISYSNGEFAQVAQLAMAWASDLKSFEQTGSGLFSYTGSNNVEVGRANDGVMGAIVGGSIEISNVDLSQEFTDLVIVQRGFQVSSQVLSVANEMLEKLLDTASSR
jgi:flagellar hook protein FlgE